METGDPGDPGDLFGLRFTKTPGEDDALPFDIKWWYASDADSGGATLDSPGVDL